MDIRHIRYFLTVAEEHNISKASQKLKITQPTLSRQIAELEQHLGVALFERKARCVELTTDGYLFKRRAQELLNIYEISCQEIKTNNEMTGTIFLGIGVLRTAPFIMKIIKAFKDKYPYAKFNIITATANVSVENIHKGELDLAILVEPVSDTNLEYLKIPVKEQWSVLMRTDSELAHKESITPKDLEKKPLIFTGRSENRNAIGSWFGRLRSKMTIDFTVNLPQNASILVGEGLGYAITLDCSAAYGNRSDLVYKPLDPPVEATTVLAWKKIDSQSRTVRTFIEFCQDYIENAVEKNCTN